jgi:phosphotriesterase-related protein
MVDLGFEDQIVLGHDISRASYLFGRGGHGYGHVLGSFLPAMRKRMPQTTIDKFLVYNPRRALAF